jgi:hypothetical protein
LYSIYNEKAKGVTDICLDGELRLSFKRTFTDEMMQSWGELVSVVENVVLSDETDALIWMYNKSGVYSSQSYYAIINYRGVTPIYVPVVWSICVPPKIHFFLWLLSHNRLAIVDNLNKNGMSKPAQCVFCDENESINHLFFECVVAKAI